MKILEINKFNYLKGGADRHFLDVVALLKSAGHNVAVFSMHSPKNIFSPWQKYFVSYVGYNRNDSTLWQKIKGVGRMFYSFEAKNKMRKLLIDFQPDIVHIHNIYHQISPSILGEIKKQNIPIVMTVHDNKLVYPHYLPERDSARVEDLKFWSFVARRKFKNSLVKSFLAALEFKAHRYFGMYAKNIDLYISPSQFTKTKLIAGGIATEKIIVLPHFSYQQDPSEEGEISSGEKYVLHFGRLSKEKGVNRLIEIFKNLPRINLYLAGRIEDDLEIPKLKNIKYAGFQSPKELEKLIKNASLVVSTSKLWETFGLIALEAIVNGKPFIGFSGEAFAEIIEDGKSGYLVRNEKEMQEKIAELYENENLRKTFSQNALRRAKDFAAQDYLQKITALFKKLTDKAKSAMVVS